MFAPKHSAECIRRVKEQSKQKRKQKKKQKKQKKKPETAEDEGDSARARMVMEEVEV